MRQFSTQLYGHSNYTACEDKRLFHTTSTTAYWDLSDHLRSAGQVVLKFQVLSGSQKCFNSVGISGLRAACI